VLTLFEQAAVAETLPRMYRCRPPRCARINSSWRLFALSEDEHTTITLLPSQAPTSEADV